MAFEVPDSYGRFSINVERRFRKLLDHRGVLTTITPHVFSAWWNNFRDERERYLGAHLLDSLVLRTDNMMASTNRHIVEMVIMRALRRCQVQIAADFDALVSILRSPRRGQALAPIRFVPVSLPGKVAKSGDTVLRNFKRTTGVSDRYFMRAEGLATQRAPISAFIFIDDCLGTGMQFGDFIQAYSIGKLAERVPCIYIPSVAHPKGIDALARSHPRIHVSPAEILTDRCGFFCGQRDNPHVWRRDGVNAVDDVREFYKRLLESRGVVPALSDRFGLDMTLGFHDATPNNTLKAMFANQNGWAPLLQR